MGRILVSKLWNSISKRALGGGEILDLDVNDIDLNTLDLPEDYDSDKLAELLAQYQGKRNATRLFCNIDF